MRRNLLGGELAMTEAHITQEVVVEPCPRCGWVKFNPQCPKCREVQEECLLLGTGIEGFDM
jgi:hypothetical protein